MKVESELYDMSNFGPPARFSWPHCFKRSLVSVSCLLLVLATWPRSLPAAPQTQAPPGYPTQAPPAQATVQGQSAPQGQAPPAPPYAQQTPEQLQQLVAPIALYPDSLVAQILAAATFPEQVVEADRWVQAHPDLKGQALGQAVDQQPWDPSVKALTAFPSVLGNMDKNISWTSSLGDAYYNQQQDVMNAVQVMRQRAEQAGNLKSTPQQTVSNEGSDVVIQPTNPDVVYVPAYDPWAVYGRAHLRLARLVSVSGHLVRRSLSLLRTRLRHRVVRRFRLGLGTLGLRLGPSLPRFRSWPLLLAQHNLLQPQRFLPRRRSARRLQRAGRGEFRGGAEAGRGFQGGRGVFNAPGAAARPFNGNAGAARGYTEPRGQSGMRSGAFNGIGRGGEARSFSSRGSSSFGGGGFRGGGGGGFHGGGGGRGGGRR